MNILGVGPLELLFIILIALIILGPKDIGKAGLTIGRWLRKMMTSDTWRTIQGTSKEIRNLPNRLMREAGLDDIKNQLPSEQEIRGAMGYDEIEDAAKEISSDLSDWTTPGNTIKPPTSSKGTTSPRPKSPPATVKQQPVEKPAETDWSTPRPKPKPAVVDEINQGENGNIEEVQAQEGDAQEPSTTYPPPIVHKTEETEQNKN